MYPHDFTATVAGDRITQRHGDAQAHRLSGTRTRLRLRRRRDDAQRPPEPLAVPAPTTIEHTARSSPTTVIDLTEAQAEPAAVEPGG